MARTLNRPPFVHPRAIPTSAIANAKDKDLPADSSSSFSRRTEKSTMPSSPVAATRALTPAPTSFTPFTTPKARFARLDSPLALDDRVAAEPSPSDYFEDLDMIAEPIEIVETSKVLPTSVSKKRPSEAVANGGEAEESAQVVPSKRLKASAVPNDIPAATAPGLPKAATPQPLDDVSASNQIRRSTRTKVSPDKKMTTAVPSAPSSFPQITKGTRHVGKGKENSERSVLRRKATTFIPKRNEAIQLTMSLGIVRAQGAVWPKKKANTLRGTAIDVICQKCCGRAHLSCAGLSPEDEYPEDWECPDCKHVRRTGATKLVTDPANYDRCIRKDCILRAKQKRKYEAGDELEYSLDKIIGRRRAPDWTPDNKVVEYLLRWNGINSATGKMWGLEDSTWEPKENIHKLEQEQMAFFEACTAEGLDCRPNNPKPVLLKEALEKWTEDGELMGDGWSKKVMAFVAAQGGS